MGKPYKVRLIHELLPEDTDIRMEFFMQLLQRDSNQKNKTIFTDKTKIYWSLSLSITRTLDFEFFTIHSGCSRVIRDSHKKFMFELAKLEIGYRGPISLTEVY